jgi:hypothetical protein
MNEYDAREADKGTNRTMQSSGKPVLFRAISNCSPAPLCSRTWKPKLKQSRKEETEKWRG